MTETTEQAAARYQAACHAMQSGVALEHSQGARDGEPKHLRVGVNSALVTDAAVTRLLIEKGVFTEQELAIALADEMEREVERYEHRQAARGMPHIRFR
jgi:hypothetical protein